jgi:hypothetical protein
MKYRQEHSLPKSMMILQPDGATTGPAGGGGTGDGDGDDDGLDGVVVDHYYPDPDTNSGDAGPIGPANSHVIYASAATPVPLNKRRTWALKQAKLHMKPSLKDSDLDTFIKQASIAVRGHGAAFGVTPDDDLMTRAGRWMQAGYLDYVIPEIYIKNAGFAKKLQDWIDLNTGPDPKPEIYPGVFTERVQRPDKNETRWDSPEIEKSLKDASDKGVHGHVHFSYRALRSPAQGGPGHPPDGHNIGDRLKAGKYKGPVIPPQRANVVANNTPTISKKLNGDYELKVTGMKVRRWVYWFHTTDGQWHEMHSTPKSKALIAKSELPAKCDVIMVKAIDPHNHESLENHRAP